MLRRAPGSRLRKEWVGTRSILAAFALVLLPAAFSSNQVWASEDLSQWKRIRSIQVPENTPSGPIAIPLDSTILTRCRKDLADVRVVSSSGGPVPIVVQDGSPPPTPEPFPTKTFRMARRPGQWTDIWVDKSSKILTQGIMLQTSAKNFVRKVEVRGSDNIKESFVIRLDALIARLDKPIPLEALLIRHPLNNFQYLHIRILEEGKTSPEIGSVLCHSAVPESPRHKTLHARVLQNRAVREENATVIVADLGEERFPVSRVEIETPDRDFVKKVSVGFSSSPSGNDWKEAFSGTFFRLTREHAAQETLHADVTPELSRYLRVKLFGPGGPRISVEQIKVESYVPAVAFLYQLGQEYSLVYDNPGAIATVPGEDLAKIDLAAALNMYPQPKVGPEQTHVVQVKQQPPRPKVEDKPRFDMWQAAGVVMLLSGLVLVFGLMLKSRSQGKDRLARNARLMNSR